MSEKVVPALGDYMAVQDPVARRMFGELKGMLQVRNADVGTGEHKWLTKADLKAAFGTDNYKLLTEGANGGGGTSTGRRTASVADVVRALQSDIAGSPLSIYLAQTIADINKPRTGLIDRMGSAETGIATERTSRVTADNAILETVTTQYAATSAAIALIQTEQSTITNNFAAQAEQVTSIQARLNNTGNGVAMEQRFVALADSDDFLFGQYTIKIQLNNNGKKYVTGYGLLASDNGDGPESLFLVRAGAFAVGEPGLNEQIPFIVKTVEFLNEAGELMPPGIYVTRAFIADFVADTGNIGDLSVSTLKIKDDAVTVSVAADISNVAITSSFQEVAAVDVDYVDDKDVPFVTGVYLHAVAWCTSSGGPYMDVGIDLYMYMDGALIAGTSQTFASGAAGNVSLVKRIPTVAGAHRFSLQIRQSAGTTPYVTGGGGGAFIVIGTKK